MCRESSCIKARIEVRYQHSDGDCSIAHDALYIEDLKANSWYPVLLLRELDSDKELTELFYKLVRLLKMQLTSLGIL